MELSPFWEEIFDMFLFFVYLITAFGIAFVVIYFFSVEVLGFDVGKAETFTIVGLTVTIFLVLVFINFVKLKQWWEMA